MLSVQTLHFSNINEKEKQKMVLIELINFKRWLHLTTLLEYKIDVKHIKSSEIKAIDGAVKRRGPLKSAHIIKKGIQERGRERERERERDDI